MIGAGAGGGALIGGLAGSSKAPSLVHYWVVVQERPEQSQVSERH